MLPAAGWLAYPENEAALHVVDASVSREEGVETGSEWSRVALPGGIVRSARQDVWRRKWRGSQKVGPNAVLEMVASTCCW